ncbi:T9SS type A sorting domain-containing protein [uncultured Winogradskyella sp.]|uniref:T9SS type A sorting domain-containing protein n=1 Tax=Winogradskyella sp. 4-2091 TaxID=3381659 RepID=UPI002627BBA6|nr:T9SS type A sorting domain-containing protein [uncultured Winogradskyella sp.]
MKTKTMLLLLLMCAYINAQSVENDTFSNGGELHSNGTNSINSTIGEPIVGTITNSETLHQGFWASTHLINTLSMSEPIEVDNDLVIYPNPAEDILNISMQKIKDYVFTIYNTEGKKTHQSTSENVLVNNLNIKHLSAGLYLLHIKDSETLTIKTMKFLKL